MKTTDLFEGLNKEQQRAVEVVDGPLLILAGAGSGKTKTLTHRIAHLMQDKGIGAEQILAVTFTNKAANEMRQRIGELMGLDGTRRSFMPFAGTFHGICVRLLRLDGDHIGIPNNFIIFDSADQLTAIKQAMKQLGIQDKQYGPRSVLGLISSAKNELVDVESYAAQATTPLQKVAAEVWPMYARILKNAGALDFDDLIGKTADLLKQSAETRSKWRRQFRYIMIDEYQDTNAAQYTLVKLLVNDNKNLCVVGDDWQSIYSWRGADYRNILNFERDYPGTTIIKLEQNYRSTKNILDAAHMIITKNQQRSDKELWTAEESGEPVNIEQVSDEIQEGELIVRKVRAAKDSGLRNYNDFAVLYRTNAQSRSVEEQMLRYGIPYKIVGGVRFYDRKEIKDIIAYVRLIYQPEDIVSFTRIVNVPTRGIGATSLARFNDWRLRDGLRLEEALARVNSNEAIPKKARTGLYNFGLMLESMREFAKEASVAELIDKTIKRAGFNDFYDDGSVENETKLENIRELVSVAKEYDNVDLAGFLEEVALISDIDSYDDNADTITLMTLHAAKGLEFPVVFMTGLEESLFPHSRAFFEPDEMEEERRLCYVGMTRAREELHMIHASRRMIFGQTQHNPPSRFLSDIDSEVSSSASVPQSPLVDTRNPWNEAPKFTASMNVQPSIDLVVGDRVKHKIFGIGKISAMEGDIATIAFPNRGAKKLNTAFAPLEKVE